NFWKGLAEFAHAVKTFGQDEGRAGLQPIHPGPHGQGGGFEGFVDVGEIQGYLDDRFHEDEREFSWDIKPPQSRTCFSICCVALAGSPSLSASKMGRCPRRAWSLTGTSLFFCQRWSLARSNSNWVCTVFQQVRRR